MESILRQGRETVDSLNRALEEYAALRPQLRHLEAYYTSRDWREDFDADAAGELPADLPRGVLSEDAVYDLLSDEGEMLRQLRRLAGEKQE